MLRITANVARSYTGRALKVGAALALLLGCPLYADECDSPNDCGQGFRCDRFSQRCEPAVDQIGCRRPDECLTGETCTPSFACRPGSCDFHGCVAGYRCGVVDSAHACVREGADNADGGLADAASPAAPLGSGGDSGAGDSGAAGAPASGAADGGPIDSGLNGAPADASL